MTEVARRYAAGFTLVELMFAVAIAAILATIALQAYGNYVISSKLSESFAMLSDYRLKMEQFKQDRDAGVRPARDGDRASGNDHHQLVHPGYANLPQHRIDISPTGVVTASR